MKKTKKQRRYRFNHDKEEQAAQNNLQVSRFMSEGIGDRDAEFGLAQDQNRDEQLVDNIQTLIEKENLLSTILNNIQVMANSGVVTLEGVVYSEEEKDLVGERAAVFAGFNNINNNLEVISIN